MINNYKTQVNRYISIKIDWNGGALIKEVIFECI